jgi:hypothetical protein
MPADTPDENLPLPELAPPNLWWRLRQHLRPTRGTRQNEPGWTTRVGWPRGEHDFFGFDPTPTAARHRIPSYNRYWVSSPYKPVSMNVVAISRHDWRLHRRRTACRASDCPDGTEHRLAQDGIDQA